MSQPKTINDQFVSYELAKLFKEKGFNEVCLAYYHQDKKLKFAYNSADATFIPYYYVNSSNMWKPLFAFKSTKEKCYTTPTYQQGAEWLEDLYEFGITVELEYISKKWYFRLYDYGKLISTNIDKDSPVFTTRKEAYEYVLTEALKLI